MSSELEELLRLGKEGRLGRQEALKLLKLVRSYGDLLKLFETSSEVRDEEVGRVYKFEAFMSPITRCTTRPPCRYCRRASGREWEPLTVDELRWGASLIGSTGIKRLEIGGGTMWEGAGEEVANAVRVVKEVLPSIRLRVNVGPSLSRDDLVKLKDLGVEEVSSNFETMNEKVFRRVKPGDSLEARVRFAKEIDKLGLKLSTTIMVGIGSSYEDYVSHVFWLKENIANLSRVSVTVLRPIKGTPMESHPAGSIMEALKLGALVRLVLRDVDLGFGGIMNDIRLLPLRIMAGGNREVHLSVMVHARGSWVRELISPSESVVVDRGRLRFVSNLPFLTRTVRELGMIPESP